MNKWFFFGNLVMMALTLRIILREISSSNRRLFCSVVTKSDQTVLHVDGQTICGTMNTVYGNNKHHYWSQ